MRTLKEIVWEYHKKTETHRLVKNIIDNTISDKLYCDFVYTQYLIFGTIEDRIHFHTGTARRQCALDDWQDMQYSLPRDLKTIERYTQVLRTCDLHDLMAHVYVNYIGLLSGSRTVKAAIEHRFPTRLYNFVGASDSIAEILEKTDTGMAADAVIQSYQMIENLYTDLYESV